MFRREPETGVLSEKNSIHVFLIFIPGFLLFGWLEGKANGAG